MSDAVAGIDEGRRIDGAIRKVDAATTTEECRQMSRRTICRNCDYPSRTCLCPSLPPTPLCSLLRKCRIVVMQHPHELRRKNRSLPLVELCMFGGGKRTGDGDGECDAPSTGEGGGRFRHENDRMSTIRRSLRRRRHEHTARSERGYRIGLPAQKCNGLGGGTTTGGRTMRRKPRPRRRYQRGRASRY